MFSVEINGLNETLAGFENYKQQADKAIMLAVSDTANAIVKTAKERIYGLEGSEKHIITRTLSRSIMRKKEHERDKFEAVVGTNLEYAPYIEFGTGDVVFQNFDFDADARAVAANYKGAGIRKVNIRGDSFLNYSGVKHRSSFLKFLTARLNAIKR